MQRRWCELAARIMCCASRTVRHRGLSGEVVTYENIPLKNSRTSRSGLLLAAVGVGLLLTLSLIWS